MCSLFVLAPGSGIGGLRPRGQKAEQGEQWHSPPPPLSGQDHMPCPAITHPCCRTRICPALVTSLQQAELYAAYWATQIAVYKGAGSVAVGVDNDAARAQLCAMSASVVCMPQRRILRRMFWLRAWSQVEPCFFRVESALNPADPLSRIHDFPRWSQVMAAAERRRKSWGMSPGQFGAFTSSRPSTRVAG